MTSRSRTLREVADDLRDLAFQVYPASVEDDREEVLASVANSLLLMASYVEAGETVHLERVEEDA